MAGLVPAIYVLLAAKTLRRGCRDKRGHDGPIDHATRAAARNHCSRLALIPDADSGLFTDMR